jgi:hypothetical protein
MTSRARCARSDRPRRATLLVSLAVLGCGRIDYGATARDGALDAPGLDAALEDAASDASEDAGGAGGDATGDGSRIGPTSEWREVAPGSASGDGVSAVGPGARVVTVRIALQGGVPWLAWTDDRSGDDDVHVATLSGSTWVGLGGSADPEGISRDAATSKLGMIAFDGAGRPHVVWNSQEPSSVHHLRWDGAAWAPLDRTRDLPTDGQPWWPVMVIDASGAPVIAYETYGAAAPSGALHVLRWSGSAWTELAGSATGAGIAPEALAIGTAIASDATDVYVAWSQGVVGDEDVMVRRWDGAAWRALGGSVSPGGISGTAGASSLDAVLALDASGRPTVAWSETTAGGDRLWVRRWDGAAWSELSGSASGDGIAAPWVPVDEGEIAIDGAGRTVAAWSHDGEIFVARHDGSAWQMVDSGDAGGISRTTTFSAWPHLAVAPDGTIWVAWEEQVGPGRNEIYVRAHDP